MPEMIEKKLYGKERKKAQQEWLREQPKAKTELGQKLMKIRSEMIATGIHFLDWDELEEEIKERRFG